MKAKREWVLLALLTLGWWSIFYPELCFTEATCQIVQESEGNTVCREKEALQPTEFLLEDTGKMEVRVTSRLGEWIIEKTRQCADEAKAPAEDAEKAERESSYDR